MARRKCYDIKKGLAPKRKKRIKAHLQKTNNRPICGTGSNRRTDQINFGGPLVDRTERCTKNGYTPKTRFKYEPPPPPVEREYTPPSVSVSTLSSRRRPSASMFDYNW